MLAGVAFGSNLGNREAQIRSGLGALQSLATDPATFRVSPLLETDPVHCPPGSGRFLNGVATFDYSGTAPELLSALQTIEQQLGRPRDRARNAPRTLDLDLLFLGPVILESEELVLPHPRISQRRFVLEPLASLHPELVLPGFRKTIRELLRALPPD